MEYEQLFSQNLKQRNIYKSLKECQDKYPECKLWIFLNGCGGNLYFVGGSLKYLYNCVYDSIQTGEIGFVTISGSGFALLNQFYSNNNVDSYDDIYTFWSENYNEQDFYYNIYKWIYDKFRKDYHNCQTSYKHISITSTFNEVNEIEWWYHDCSKSSNFLFEDYIKTLVASSHLGFLDRKNKYKGIKLADEQYHRDGGLWITTPENTLNLFNHVNSKIENVSHMYNISLGLFLNSRETSISLYVKGYKKTRDIIDSKTQLFNELEYYISKNKTFEKNQFEQMKKEKINKMDWIKLINSNFLMENICFFYKLSTGILKYIQKKILENDLISKSLQYFYIHQSS